MCIFGSHGRTNKLVVQEQTSVSHGSTDSEGISLDAGLHMNGIPALHLWHFVIEVFILHRTKSTKPKM